MDNRAPENTIRSGLTPRNATKAQVYVLPTDPPALVKDYSRAGVLIRLYGQFSLRHEYRALKRLADIKGIPLVRERSGPNVLVMEFVDARPLAELKRERAIPPGFIDRLAALFEAIEARGVAHGDPHYRNILCDAEGVPYLVDFSFCYLRGALPVIDRWVFRNFVDMRRKKLWKLRRSLEVQGNGEPVRVGCVYAIAEAVGEAYKRLRKAFRERRHGIAQQAKTSARRP